MGKKLLASRVDQEDYDFIQGYEPAGSITQATETAIHRLRQLEDNARSMKVQTPEETEALNCFKRIELAGDLYCVEKPPKATKLISLEVCEVCKKRNMGFTTSIKVKQPEAINNSIRATQYCHNLGIMVLPSRCEKCNDFACPLKLAERKMKEVKRYSGGTP